MATRRRRRFTAEFKKRVALEALRGTGRCRRSPPARGPSEPGEHLEAAGHRRTGRDLRRRQSVSPIGARGDGPGPAREDRRADGGTGFFSARVPTLSRAERLEMVDRDDALSISRQCALLGISRSSVYYTPRGRARRAWH